jgi:hypothetical protein
MCWADGCYGMMVQNRPNEHTADNANDDENE